VTALPVPLRNRQLGRQALLAFHPPKDDPGGREGLLIGYDVTHIGGACRRVVATRRSRCHSGSHVIVQIVATAEVVTRQPHLALRRYVDRYVGYRLEGYPSGVHRGFPSRSLTFIVRLDEASAVVAGLRTSAALLPHDGRHHGIAIELTVRAARALFATPSGALTASAADLTDLLGRTARALPERLAAASSWQHRFEILDQVLLSSLDPGRQPAPEVVHGWGLLTRFPEGPSIESVAQAVGWSRRHFTEMFGREVGLPPRQFLRVVRFERSCHLVRSTQRAAMTEIALRAGYFDHAHMLHEWHALAGCRPDQWLAEELLSVQAEANAAP
jgi:AraC-like DNA-binding protein